MLKVPQGASYLLTKIKYLGIYPRQLVLQAWVKYLVPKRDFCLRNKSVLTERSHEGFSEVVWRRFCLCNGRDRCRRKESCSSPDWHDSLPRYPDEERARLLALSFATATNAIGLMGTIFPPDLYETGGYFLNRVGNCLYMFSTPLLTLVALIVEKMSVKTDCLVRVR